MRSYKYVGIFISSDNNTYELTFHCNGAIEAFILLTAEAIKSGKHYQLSTITDEKGNVFKIDNICKITALIK